MRLEIGQKLLAQLVFHLNFLTALRKPGATSAGRTPSRRGDPWPEPGSGSRRDPAHPPDPAGHTPDGPRPATHVAMAAERWSDPAARGGTTWASAYPIVSPRSIAATAFWADSGASVESGDWIYARQAPNVFLAGIFRRETWANFICLIFSFRYVTFKG